MIIEGRVHYAASQAEMFRAFTDPERIRTATPGCQSLVPIGDDKWEAVMKLGVAGITGTYKGTVELQDKHEPDHYRLLVKGEGAPGHVSGKADFQFTPGPDGGVDVQYLWDLQVGGLVASVGQRVLSSVGKMLVGQFITEIGKSIA